MHPKSDNLTRSDHPPTQPVGDIGLAFFFHPTRLGQVVGIIKSAQMEMPMSNNLNVIFSPRKNKVEGEFMSSRSIGM